MADPTFSIPTKRLLLIYPLPSSPSHADFIVELYNTPEFIASIGGKPTSITTRDSAAKYIQNRFVSEHERNGYGTYLIALKQDSAPNSGDVGDFAGNKLVGTVSLSRGADPDTSYAAPDLGFAILPEYCRRGIATEASQGLMEWVNREKGIDVFLGLHDPQNTKSAGVFQKLGFQDQGRRKLKVFGDVVGQVWTRTVRVGRNGWATEDDVRALGLPARYEEGGAAASA